ncbi:MAG TPA: anti-sigma factor [Sphingomonas sp.]|jgi:anti-sigma-K factor RskA|uniref:anti-sigma factor n=1 Tax=Sphingomonas sp. TaxID=28214 RepID=UPI002EDB0948
MTDDMDMTAAEYVLGTLDPEERRAFEHVLVDDPRAVAAVAIWRQRFAVLDATAAEVTPSVDLWHRIEAAAGLRAANDNRVARGWRSLAVAAALIAAVSSSLAVVGWRRPAGAAPMDAVAALTPEGTTPALLVGWHGDSGRYEIRPLALPIDAAHSRQLWLIVEGGGPRSMGLVDTSARWIDGSALQPGQAATIAVSIEPIGGSPTGAPTGPVVLSGKLTRMPSTI